MEFLSESFATSATMAAQSLNISFFISFLTTIKLVSQTSFDQTTSSVAGIFFCRNFILAEKQNQPVDYNLINVEIVNEL